MSHSLTCFALAVIIAALALTSYLNATAPFTASATVNGATVSVSIDQATLKRMCANYRAQGIAGPVCQQ